MLVAAAAQLPPSKLVQFLKGRLSRMLQREFPALRKPYWGQHLWARGYIHRTGGPCSAQVRAGHPHRRLPPAAAFAHCHARESSTGIPSCRSLSRTFTTGC